MKKILFAIIMMSLCITGAFSQSVQARIINTPDNGVMRVAGVNSMSWSERALYTSAGRLIANWGTQFSVDTIADRTGSGVRIDGVLLNNGVILGSAISGNISGSAASVTGTVGVANGGTGLTASPTNGQLPIGNGSGYTLATLTGTSNAITISNSAGGITLNTPQPIGTTSTVQFATVTGFSNTAGQGISVSGAAVGDKLMSVSNTSGNAASRSTFRLINNSATIADIWAGSSAFTPTAAASALNLSSLNTIRFIPGTIATSGTAEMTVTTSGVQVDTLLERTSNAGINVDGSVAKDGGIVYVHGAVTQLTSITTSVTVNAPSGTITTVVPNITALTAVTFTVNNSFATAASSITLTVEDGSGSLTPTACIGARAAGSFTVKISNLTASPFASALIIHFKIN